jgi:hypothetical protein
MKRDRRDTGKLVRAVSHGSYTGRRMPSGHKNWRWAMGETTIQVTTFECHVRHGVGIGGPWQDEPLWYAVVGIGGATLHFSRYDCESEWYCDAHFGAGGVPYFCHGEGSRCCLKKVATGRLRQALEARRNEWGNRPAVSGRGAA